MSTETLRGQVESVRLFRDSWGTMQLLAGSANERTTVVGTLLGFDRGDTIEVSGCWSTHPTYGRRFKAASIVVIAPTDASGAIAWLRGRMPQIGRKLATEMVERWGLPGLWDVLAERPHELASENGGLRGITPERAAKIGEAYQAHRAERDRMVTLKQYELTDRQIGKVIEKWGEAAIEKLRADPYALAEEIDGFGFLRADRVARAMRLPADHPSRIRAGLEHVLSEARGEGHTYMPAGKLIAVAARKLLGIDEAIVRHEANRALEEGRLVLRCMGGGTWRAYAPELDAAEQAVADAVRRLVRGERSERAEREREGSEAA